jgi:hypothetical protein
MRFHLLNFRFLDVVEYISPRDFNGFHLAWRHVWRGFIIGLGKSIWMRLHLFDFRYPNAIESIPPRAFNATHLAYRHCWRGYWLDLPTEPRKYARQQRF